LQGSQQCWALWAFLAACPCTLFIDIISLCLLIGQIKMLACLLVINAGVSCSWCVRFKTTSDAIFMWNWKMLFLVKISRYFLDVFGFSVIFWCMYCHYMAATLYCEYHIICIMYCTVVLGVFMSIWPTSCVCAYWLVMWCDTGTCPPCVTHSCISYHLSNY